MGTPGHLAAMSVCHLTHAISPTLQELSRESLLAVISTFVAASRHSNVSACLPTADDLLHALPHM